MTTPGAVTVPEGAAVRPPLPKELQLEVTGACNLRCRMCLVRYRPPVNRVTGSLPFEDFVRLVDGNPELESVILQGLGEPLLAPRILDMVAYAAARGVRVGFNTNGTLLTRRKAVQLVDAGLHWLYVSVDGATAGTYESIRDGATFAKVAANIAGLAEVKRARDTDRPHVRLVFVAMRRNVGELAGVVRLAHEWAVDEVWVQNLSHSFSDTDPGGSYVEIRGFTEDEALWAGERGGEDAFAAARATADDLGVTLRLPHLTEPAAGPRAAGTRGCDWPWDSAYVTYDGTVQPCCMVMGSDRAQLGNVNEESFAAIWHGDAYARFREALLGDDPPDVCRGCSVYRHTF